MNSKPFAILFAFINNVVYVGGYQRNSACNTLEDLSSGILSSGSPPTQGGTGHPITVNVRADPTMLVASIRITLTFSPDLSTSSTRLVVNKIFSGSSLMRA